MVLLGVGLSLLFRQLGGSWVIEPSHLVQVPVADSLAGLPRVPAVARLLAVVEPGGVHRRRDDRRRGVAGDAAEPGGGRQDRPAAADLAPEPGAAGPGGRERGLRADRRAPGHVGHRPQLGEHQRRGQDEARDDRPRRPAAGQRRVPAGLAEPDPAVLPGGDPAGHGGQAGQPGAGEADVGRGAVPVHPVRADGGGHRPDRPADRRPDRAGGEHRLHPHSNVRRPIRRIVEKHLGGDVMHIELANQVSFLNRAALSRVLDEVPRGGHVLLDAQSTDYIDPDVLDLIRDFKEQTAPARGVEVSLLGFRSKYQLEDQTQYVDYSTRELQDALTPQQVLQILKDGHERFRTGQRLTRDLGRQVSATAGGQHPLAVVLSCIDSRTPAELIFDLGVGDIFSVRIAGNVTSRKVLGSMEYGCAVAGAKLILVMGHTRCGAVTAAVDLICATRTAAEATGCQHLDHIVDDIQQSIDPAACRGIEARRRTEKEAFVDAVARRNVSRVVERMRAQSQTLDGLVRERADRDRRGDVRRRHRERSSSCNERMTKSREQPGFETWEEVPRQIPSRNDLRFLHS